MRVNTTRFGRLEIQADDVLLFPNGVLGLEDCRHWVLLADAENEALGWLQSISRPEIAMAVVSPRRFVPGWAAELPFTGTGSAGGSAFASGSSTGFSA